MGAPEQGREQLNSPRPFFEGVNLVTKDLRCHGPPEEKTMSQDSHNKKRVSPLSGLVFARSARQRGIAVRKNNTSGDEIASGVLLRRVS